MSVTGGPTPQIPVKRVYDPACEADGFRVLVDRLWPRGVSKERAALDAWAKSIAPSDDLRRFFGHVPERYPEFARRYRAELAANPAFPEFLDALAGHPVVTLLFGARDTEHNEAVVLSGVVTDQLHARSRD